MQIRRLTAAGGAIAVAGLLTAAPALAARVTVSVRVEGVSRTLLRARTVTLPVRGSVTKGGAPRGACPANHAVGALNAATRGDWGGTYSGNALGTEVTTILGERHSFSSKYFWGIWVNDKLAPAGVCDLKLHRGDQLLFSAAPVTGTVVPIVISAPARAREGRPLKVRVSYLNDKGRMTPLAGASLSGGSFTRQGGVATITPHRAGRLVLTASHKGYVRDEATVTVTRL